MRFNFGFHSSILLIFFVHTLVYGILFYFRYKKQQQQSGLWMGLFLVLAAWYIAPWMLGFAGWYAKQPYRDLLFYIPFQHLFVMGPIVYFYVVSLLNPRFRVRGRNWLHFLPGLLYLLFCGVMVVYDKIVLGEYFFLKNQQDPDFDDWYQITGYISMIIYFSAAIQYYYNYRRTIRQVVSNVADFLFSWVRNFLIAFLLILVSWFCVAVFGLFYDVRFVISWWYFLSFALCCYYMAIAGYSNAVEAKLFFKSSFFSKDHTVYLPRYHAPGAIGYEPAPFEMIQLVDSSGERDEQAPQLQQWKAQIEQQLEYEQMYQQPELTLFDLAKKLNTNISVLSGMINRSFGSNFNDLVNSYRIRHFIGMLRRGEHKRQTLLALAYDAGFNSKTTFNRAFKKNTGLSPQAFIKQNSL